MMNSPDGSLPPTGSSMPGPNKGNGGTGSPAEIERIHPTLSGTAPPGSPIASDPRTALVRDLASPEDDSCLSGLMCLLREQIEVFAATSADVSDRTSKRSKGAAGGGPSGAQSKETVNSPVPITLGRVGIRCKHCAHLPKSAKAKGAVSYPNSIRIMNQAVRNWQRYHFGVCKEIPTAIMDRYDELKAGKRMHSSKASQEYWPRSCHRLGLVDGPDGGIFFEGDAEAVQLYEEAAAAQKKAAAEAEAAGDGIIAPKPRPKMKKATKKNKRDGGDGQTQDMSMSQPQYQHAGAMGSYYPTLQRGGMMTNAAGLTNGIGGMNMNMNTRMNTNMPMNVPVNTNANGSAAGAAPTPFETAIDDADLNFDDVNVNDLDLDLDAWLQDEGNIVWRKACSCA